MIGKIRLVTEADAADVQAIYEPYVRETAISCELEPPTVGEMQRRIRETLALMPWLVYETAAGQVAGYAYAHKFRERAAYQWSVEVSAYVDARLHRSGIGRGLYTSLFALLYLQGFCNIYAGITLPNAKSVGLHQAMGFQQAGVYPHVGYKLGRWHDVSQWCLLLPGPLDPPPPPRPLAAVVKTPEWELEINRGLPLIKV
ncbi:MAG TPA: arsinothricin resistance N-acetyltransferase ArsN1 family B [Phototrophicaceae bacterium]|nr:arsinothricin resistance N-acetyltransferase ArsN1 family B [Phototrophicaceae bacterium]